MNSDDKVRSEISSMTLEELYAAARSNSLKQETIGLVKKEIINRERNPQQEVDKVVSRREDHGNLQPLSSMLEAAVAHKVVESQPTINNEPVHSDFSSKVMKRYNDAYLVAKTTTAIGSIVKVSGILIGTFIVLLSISLSADNRVNPMLTIAGGVIAGVIIAIPFYVLGILVTANGQILKASLDGAVHSSPFINNRQKASIMSID